MQIYRYLAIAVVKKHLYSVLLAKHVPDIKNLVISILMAQTEHHIYIN